MLCLWKGNVLCNFEVFVLLNQDVSTVCYFHDSERCFQKLPGEPMKHTPFEKQGPRSRVGWVGYSPPTF